MIDGKNSSENCKKPLKRIAAIHDLSCFGRCALTVVMPALSAMGYQVIPVPTALLSSHTGGFTDMYFKDLTQDMREVSDHFDRLELKFDAIYTGFLGSEEQIDIVLDFIKRFSDEDTLIFVDPVMGDDGVLYSTYTDRLGDRMKELCAVADIITPNLTEACFMLGKPYMASGYTKEYIEDMLRALTDLGCPKAVLTGVGFNENELGCYGYDSTTGEFFFDTNERISQSFHGTGDIFASVCFSCLNRGKTLEESCAIAADFVCDSMNATITDETPIWYGVHFEKVLASGKYLI